MMHFAEEPWGQWVSRSEKAERDKGEWRGQGKNGPGDATADFLLYPALHS